MGGKKRRNNKFCLYRPQPGLLSLLISLSPDTGGYLEDLSPAFEEMYARCHILGVVHPGILQCFKNPEEQFIPADNSTNQIIKQVLVYTKTWEE